MGAVEFFHNRRFNGSDAVFYDICAIRGEQASQVRSQPSPNYSSVGQSVAGSARGCAIGKTFLTSESALPWAISSGVTIGAGFAAISGIPFAAPTASATVLLLSGTARP